MPRRINYVRIEQCSAEMELDNPALDGAHISVRTARQLIAVASIGGIAKEEYARLVLKVQKLEAEKKELEADMRKMARLIEPWL